MVQIIARSLGLPPSGVKAVVRLLQEGATIPFIARYRKEQTGSLDEVQIEQIEKSYQEQIDLEKRKESILERLKELLVDNESLLNRIRNCTDPIELEDLYLPYKQKRETRADKAKKLGLLPLAKMIMAQGSGNVLQQARHFAARMSVEDALQGARDIIAEWVSENVQARNNVRRVYQRSSAFKSKVKKGKELEGDKYRDYFKFEHNSQRIPSHRLLALYRAEKEGIVQVKMLVDDAYVLEKLENQFVKEPNEAGKQVKKAVKDAYKRLLAPSLENEIRNELKIKADKEAIDIFANNLQQLLMAAPLGPKSVLALDPGFKSGCKLVCLDKQGNLKHHGTIFPHPPQNQVNEAKNKVQELVRKYEIEAFAIGNGTAGRETEEFIKTCIPKDKFNSVYMVNESGASIYSASEVGRNEFPDLDLTVRGAISIGRRLIDPLAELVKIDPKSIGVGQYQHDVAQDKLKSSLGNTVVFTVNRVGVNINTASVHLLQYVAGVGPKLAESIIDYRMKSGQFHNREELKKVKGFGPKSFEQAAGFLRLMNGDNPLDETSVHPERYDLVKRIAENSKCRIQDLVKNEDLLNGIDLDLFVDENVGLPTLKDIIEELKKPGLDPRGAAQNIDFDEHIKTIEDVKRNMVLQGRVTNLTKFGAFVDIGIKDEALLHISQITEGRINDPAEILSIGQILRVRILDVDLDRGRVGLSLRGV